MDSNKYKKISDRISSFCPVSEQEMAEIAKFFTVAHLKKNEYFLKEEQVCKKIGFLNTGLIRHYYATNHKEVTRWMSLPNDFTTSLRSFILKIPSIENLQAVTACELYITIEDRVFSLIEKSAEERFEWMAKTQIRFIQQVPVMYTASMLGITPRHLSRLRKKHTI